ncbi:hypothetical protein Htur_5214 (plasmid) [Haloterrigena turkmenica DSM 5511]|uniref:Uncharacterized protein n=1 Tax=Haloterrigena turkmenica (strain ATCC 51198 / DSM 5511 / JCM 9101 / NCIMB 13204 / VKM B-1734 / 4k) TaxID=543526 RepID=D2S398_HALTV|nr:hypothetical protein [Haloterrigena turkmenica]ADB63845.1 hypothetical protein Htur_5214 [Haloterrigena turkmenica DSM 5511]
MIDVSLGFILSSLPWWLAAPLVQLAVLVVGMALDETYVNRTTVLMGALATHIHIFVAGEAGLLVSIYADAGLAVGAYGLYAYVVDGYVATWFRLLAYYVYSPLSVFLVILTAGPTVIGLEPLVVLALAGAGYANYQFREYLRPDQPFYFGPRTQEEFEAVLETEVAAGSPVDAEAADTETADSDVADPGAAAGETAPGTAAAGTTSSPTSTASSPAGTEPAEDGAEFDHPGAEPAAASDSSERGILPKFMRRL